MKIAILSGPFFHDCKEITRTIDGQQVKGKDKIIFGGAERLLIDLCELLQSMNNTVTVYQPLSGINKPFAKQYKGITFVMIPNSGTSWGYHTCVDLNWQFNELSAMDDMFIYFATYLAFPYAKSPSIAISHGIYWDNVQGNSIINTFTDEQRKEFFKRQLYGFTAPDVVVSVDSNVRKVIQAMMPGAEKQIQIIYNYCDTQKFSPVEKTWEGINVLFPRRLTALRGSTEITRAFINYPQYNFTLVGQAHDENAANAFTDGHKNRGNVKFTHKETDEMPDMYNNIDISVIPTIASEGLSLSLLESMSCGLPVITTPVGGLGDAVIHGYNAIVYDPNHEDLGQYIDYLAKNPDIREKFGKRNREIAVECFDIEIWKAKWKALINSFGG
jgi:glycosyltransferase involved in cell wall biosynthesis